MHAENPSGRFLDPIFTVDSKNLGPGTSKWQQGGAKYENVPGKAIFSLIFALNRPKTTLKVASHPRVLPLSAARVFYFDSTHSRAYFISTARILFWYFISKDHNCCLFRHTIIRKIIILCIIILIITFPTDILFSTFYILHLFSRWYLFFPRSRVDGADGSLFYTVTNSDPLNSVSVTLRTQPVHCSCQVSLLLLQYTPVS